MRCHFKTRHFAIFIALAFLTAVNLWKPALANNTASCGIAVLEELGWQTGHLPDTADILNADACKHELTPYFNVNVNNSGTPNTASDSSRLLSRIKKAARSDTSRCLFNRSLRGSVRNAALNLKDNTTFVFPKPGEDPRDPFTPPTSQWSPSPKRGYDSPVNSLVEGIHSLYSEPVIAECATAIQVAQIATLVERLGDEIDLIAEPQDIGIGVWPEFAKSPSIRANSPLLISRKQRRVALKRLATLGRGAFYNQSGYISPVNNTPEFIDSQDNRGQNFLIIDISEAAVADLVKRNSPLKELNRTTLQIWHTYNRLRLTGLSMDILVGLVEKKLRETDSFFSDITVYIHPLGTGTFARFLARQFRHNPRTAYKLEVYEDFQTGYFYDRFISHRLTMCESE